jgi:opioid growth factor receptor-like protein
MPGNIRLTGFLSGDGPDSEGRLLDEILRWPDDRLERVHDFIQWLFPLTEPSPVNPEAPVLDAETIAEIRAQPQLQANLRQSYERMRRFYESSRNWVTPGNHNHLRMTRILKCLCLLGLDAEAKEFFEWLSVIYTEEARRPHPGISTRSFEFWRNAVGG